MSGVISEKMRFTKVKDPSADGTADVTSDSVDMVAEGGWDGVVFLMSYGTAAADNLFHVEQSDDDDSFADLEGGEIDLGGASDEDQGFDVLRPVDRYVRVVAERGTSSTLGDIWAIQYRGRIAPFDNNVLGTMAFKALVSPAEGTK